jgi:hypothetical protein
MKQLLSFFGLLVFSLGYTQTHTTLRGKVLSDTIAIAGVEVINLNTEQSTKTDGQGIFKINAKIKDVLAFYSKEYVFKKVVVESSYFQEGKCVVKLVRSAIELDEVVVKNSKFEVPKFTYEQAAESRIAKQAANPKNPNVYDGTITNGMDFIEIGRKIIGLFKNPDAVKKRKIPEEDFKAYARNSLDATFYQQKLQLQKYEIDSFLAYCAEDPESKKVFINKDQLTLMDFLYTKHKVYKVILERAK